jgi:hypothetical protein
MGIVNECFGKELCTILGLDATKVSRISIEVEADDIVRVNVQTYLLLKEAEMLATLIRTEYKLVRTDKEPEIVPE